MTMQFRLPAVKYDTPDKIWAMFERAVAEIRAVPGVKSAALVRAFPFTGNGDVQPFIVEGQPPAKPADAPQVQINIDHAAVLLDDGHPAAARPRRRDVGHEGLAAGRRREQCVRDEDVAERVRDRQANST